MPSAWSRWVTTSWSCWTRSPASGAPTTWRRRRRGELKLDRKLADKRIFPAIDPDPSGTRKEELLLAPDELAVMHRLRRVLSALDSQQALELVLDRLRKTRTNIEFLMQVAKTTPQKDED